LYSVVFCTLCILLFLLYQRNGKNGFPLSAEPTPLNHRGRSLISSEAINNIHYSRLHLLTYRRRFGLLGGMTGRPCPPSSAAPENTSEPPGDEGGPALSASASGVAPRSKSTLKRVRCRSSSSRSPFCMSASHVSSSLRNVGLGADGESGRALSLWYFPPAGRCWDGGDEYEPLATLDGCDMLSSK